MKPFAIADLPLGAGRLGICRMPGRAGDYAGDLGAVLGWGPALVLTMTGQDELERCGAAGLSRDLAAAGIAWRHLPVQDFGANSPGLLQGWPGASAQAHAVLTGGGRVLAHCMGGCGRSGMALLRLMVEAGEAADAGLERLRAVRPCAVETEEQRAWGAAPMGDRQRRDKP